MTVVNRDNWSNCFGCYAYVNIRCPRRQPCSPDVDVQAAYESFARSSSNVLLCRRCERPHHPSLLLFGAAVASGPTSLVHPPLWCQGKRFTHLRSCLVRHPGILVRSIWVE